MLAKRIIPCLDVRAGRVTKGVRFKNNIDLGDPAELAAYYDREGADELVFYDILASHEGRSTQLDWVRRTADQVFIPFLIGGGVNTVTDMRALLLAGADKISVNSAAVRRPEIIEAGAEQFGSQCIVVSVDCLRRPGINSPAWEVVIDGGRVRTGLDVREWVERAVELGAGELVLNSIDADGTRDGYDNELNSTVAQAVNIPVIASGGAGTVEHLRDGIIMGKADAVLVASIVHSGEIRIAAAKDYLTQQGIPIRPVNTNLL